MPKVAGIGALVHDFISVGGRQMRKALYLVGYLDLRANCRILWVSGLTGKLSNPIWTYGQTVESSGLTGKLSYLDLRANSRILWVERNRRFPVSMQSPGTTTRRALQIGPCCENRSTDSRRGARDDHQRCRAKSAHIRQSRPDSGLSLSHFWQTS